MWLFGLVWGFLMWWERLLSYRNMKRMRSKLEKMGQGANKINKKWINHMIEENESAIDS